MEYKVGDKVIVIDNLDESDISHGFKVGEVLTVKDCECGVNIIWFEEYDDGLFKDTIELIKNKEYANE